MGASDVGGAVLQRQGPARLPFVSVRSEPDVHRMQQQLSLPAALRGQYTAIDRSDVTIDYQSRRPTLFLHVSILELCVDRWNTYIRCDGLRVEVALLLFLLYSASIIIV